LVSLRVSVVMATLSFERISNAGHWESSGSALDFSFRRTTIQIQKRGLLKWY